MRCFPSAVTAVLLFGFVGAALAAEATGAIRSLDANKNIVTLDDGSTYMMVKGVNLAGFKPGERVTVTYTQSGKTMAGTAIKPAS